ncbi:hypothetical protein H0W32_03285 [Patescibacteria group bacterium]|nr:hypothetical protein [Patescibacteria group bacterium]
MSSAIVVHKGRTNIIPISLGVDVSGDVFTSQIRSEPDVSAPLIATWDVEFETNGVDGELILTLDDTLTGQIRINSGYMDLKRMSNGEALPVFDRPLEVIFRGSVTNGDTIFDLDGGDAFTTGDVDLDGGIP